MASFRQLRCMLPVVGRRGLPAPVPLVLAHTSENVRFSLHLKQSDCSFSTTAAKTSNPPLKHIRLVELAGVLAGPTCGQFFAELGAEVIKIENPRIGGDVTRGWKLRPYDTEPSSYFQGCNLGKKSLSINLKNDDDKRTLHNLIRTADIVTVSYKPGDAEKLEVDYDTLRKLNPKLIYVQITGYGLDSGDHRPGYDACIQAESGFQFMNGEKGGLPVKMPVAMVDLLAAHQMKQGILLALLQRERENKGKLITVSLLKSAVVSCANQASGYLLAGKIPQRIGSDHPSIVPYGTVYFDEDNKPFVLAVGTDVQFRSLLIDVLGVVSRVPEKWKRNVQRVDDKEAVNELLSGVTSSSDRAMADDAESTAVKLKSKQEEIFEVEKEVACRSVTVKNMVDDTGLDTPVPLPMVDSKILIKVIEYCKYHHKAEHESLPDDEKNTWDKDFVKVDDETLFNLILAANYLDIKSLLDLTCKTVADEIKGKTPEEIRIRFNIKNDFTPEEEEEVKRENAWCEER